MSALMHKEMFVETEVAGEVSAHDAPLFHIDR